MDYENHHDETIAWINLTNCLSPWLRAAANTYYRVILRTNDYETQPAIYIGTSNVNGEYREVKVFYKEHKEANLRNILHTIFGRKEVARAISILTQCSYVDKKPMSESVLEDMRFIESPFDISYVDCGSICPGTILDVSGDPVNKTNRFVIRPNGEPTTRINKVSGEVNIPFRNWRKE